MTALEARAASLESQHARWMKLSSEARNAIEDATSRGELHCFVSALYDMEVLYLRKLGYTVRDIVEDTIEISW